MRMQQEQKQRRLYHQITNFNSSKMQMVIKTLTHDYYIIELPENRKHQFYKFFPFYLEEFDYKGNLIKIAPVARIYGTNQFGQKCCVHIHGYFSHFYIKADQFSQAFRKDKEFLKAFLGLLQGIYQRAYSINKPIIFNAVTEQKMDFYGYHEKPETFLKIIVYDPAYIIKLRQLLDSKIVGGKTFQCYEAHINYFMQLFSDHNIFGINQLNIMQFSFRKNLSPELMDLFKKLNTQTKKIFKEGYDVIEIEKKNPGMFNPLQKISACYIEVDLWMNSILNTFASQHQILDSDEQKSIDSEFQMSRYDLGQFKLKFEVKITKALEQIWDDEIKRRQTYGIKEKPEGIIDYSKNIEANKQKDMYWINFLKKGSNFEQFIQMIRSSVRGTKKQQTNDIEICREIAENYTEVLENQKQKLIERVLARWKYYGSRKKNYIEQLMKGEREQLPEWDDDKNSQTSSLQQKQEQQGEQLQLNETKSQAPKVKNVSNTVLYRNNYKHSKATLKKGSYFYICLYCKKNSTHCKCDEYKNYTQSTQDNSINSQIQMLTLEHKAMKNRIKVKYDVPAPTFEQVLEDSFCKAQKPYYSNLKDLFSYHKINSVFEPCLKHAQILDRQLLTIKQYNREPITIKNELKLPYYFEINMKEENEQIQKQLESKNYRVKYELTPPSFNQILEESIKIMETKNQDRRSTSMRPTKDQSFVSDLIVFHYQFIVGFETGSQRYCGDPEKDQIICFSYQIRNFQEYRKFYKGLIIIQKYAKKQNLQVWQYQDIYFVKNQYDLLSMIISIIFRVDPDLLVTYDQQKKGIRYLTQRGFAHGINFQALISRSCQMDEIFQFINFREFKVIKQMYLTRQILLTGNILEAKNKTGKASSQLTYLQKRLKQSLKKRPVLRQKYRFDLEIKGRVNICLYRICEQQLKLRSYTLQNVTKHLFGEQIAEFTDGDLFKFFIGETILNKDTNKMTKKLTVEEGVNYVIQYLNKRLELQAEIVTNMNIISVLVQKSKVYGSDIVSMMERGSQFKIEAILCRVTKKLGYLTLSASKRQVGNQSVLQCFPLVIQPPKQFFPDPVLVFDFQSLYPSIMIAYNLCYSTCLGSINNIFDRNKLKKIGVSEKMNIDIEFLQQILRKCDEEEAKKKIQSLIFVTPNKIAYIKKDIREGVIPRILLEFLMTRIMIKKSEGLYTKAKIKKILKDRQYALKLFMNVMFGYTGASFSGRMPCSQIADSIVQLSKYNLRQAIDYLNSHPKYKGKVIYGDTDSIFFHMAGYKISEAFNIGKQLALEITNLFPYPIQMKFEKVYDGLFLVAKKRYYGKMYQSEKGSPKYEGKGVQCVRRDGISLTENLMREMLNNLIDNRDLSLLKQIFKQQSAKILNNEKLQQELILAKEVKLIKYNQKTIPAHGEAAKRLQKIDPMFTPKYAERMKYFVINGGLKPIKQRSIAVFQYLMNKNMSLDLDYYFRKQVLPPMQRILSSLADLNEWSASIQYRHKFQFAQAHQLQVNKKCLHCHGETYYIVCQKCLDKVQEQIQKVQQIEKQGVNICETCTGSRYIAEANRCVEWNCKQLWKRRGIQKMKKNIYPELLKLKDAIKQLNF